MKTSAGAEKTATGTQILRVLACVSAVSLASGPASAQERDLESGLRAGLQCAYADPAGRLASNIAKSGAEAIELLSTLTAIADDSKTCGAIRSAAEAEVQKLNALDVVIEHKELVLAQQRMETALREADKSAAEMRFVVGPPPRRLTHNNSSVP